MHNTARRSRDPGRRRLRARRYKFFWQTHKWTGAILAVVFLNIAGTGFLLLVKKRWDWLQPPTREGAVGQPEDFLSLGEVFEVVFDLDHEDFRTLEDIDRVDFRPGKRVHKVQSRHHHAEIQVDAVTGAVLSVDWRPSDLLEDLHDGSFYAAWIHDGVMPFVAIGLIFLTGSGLYLWLSPILRKRRHRRVQARRSAPQKPKAEPATTPARSRWRRS